MRKEIDLGYRYSVLRFEGSDSRDFLQRQLSNDVSALDQDHAQVNAYLTPKGRVIGLLTLVLDDDAVLALVDRQMAETLCQSMQRYIIRSDVRIQQLESRYRIVGRFDSGRDSLSQLDALPVNRDSGFLELDWPGSRRIILKPANLADAPLQANSDLQASSRWESLDIKHSLARISSAQSEQFVPQMLALDELKVVSFKKGCYPGQEVVARTHYRGRIKRRLVAFKSAVALDPGTTLAIAEGGETKSVGQTLQSVDCEPDQYLGLAVVHESGIDARQLVTDTEPPITVHVDQKMP